MIRYRVTGSHAELGKTCNSFTCRDEAVEYMEGLESKGYVTGFSERCDVCNQDHSQNPFIGRRVSFELEDHWNVNTGVYGIRVEGVLEHILPPNEMIGRDRELALIRLTGACNGQSLGTSGGWYETEDVEFLPG